MAFAFRPKFFLQATLSNNTSKPNTSY